MTFRPKNPECSTPSSSETTSTPPSLLYRSPPRARKLALEVACSRYSDSGKDTKKKATRKVDGVGKRKKEGREILRCLCSPQIPPVLLSCLRFLNSADYLGALIQKVENRIKIEQLYNALRNTHVDFHRLLGKQ